MRFFGKNYWAALAALVLGFSSCSSDEPDVPEVPSPSDYGNVALPPELVVMTYDTFISENDVKIASADTTSIEVDKAYLTKLGKQIGEGSVLSIWRTMESRPFVRKVTQVKEQEDVVLVTSTAGDVGDIFKDADVEMSSTLYVNSKAGLPNADRYTDTVGNIVHPAVLIVEDEGSTYGEEGQAPGNPLPRAYTAEQLLENQPTDATWHIIDKNIKATAMFSAGKMAKLGIQDAQVHAYADLDINFKVKMFRLKKFDFVARAGVDANIPVVMKAEAKAELSKEFLLAQLPTYTMVFWIGPVPVGITIDPTVQFAINASVTGRIQFQIPIEAQASLTLGPTYNGRWSFRKDLNLKTSAKLTRSEFSGTYEAKASAGLCLKIGSYLYTMAGPYVEAGPSIETDNMVTADDEVGLLKLHTSAKAKIGSKVGAELKVWKWSLASFEYELPPFCEQQLWDYEKYL